MSIFCFLFFYFLLFTVFHFDFNSKMFFFMWKAIKYAFVCAFVYMCVCAFSRNTYSHYIYIYLPTITHITYLVCYLIIFRFLFQYACILQIYFLGKTSLQFEHYLSIKDCRDEIVKLVLSTWNILSVFYCRATNDAKIIRYLRALNLKPIDNISRHFCLLPNLWFKKSSFFTHNFIFAVYVFFIKYD